MKVGTLIISSIGVLVVSFGIGALIQEFTGDGGSAINPGAGGSSYVASSSDATPPSSPQQPKSQPVATGNGTIQGQPLELQGGQPLQSVASATAVQPSSTDFEVRQLAITNKSAAESKFYSFNVSPRLDNTVYRLYDNGEMVRESSNGIFSNVPPTASGQYQLVVVSTSGMEISRKMIGGFNMVNRLTSSQVEGILNGQSENSYKFFDVKNLQMKAVGSVPEDIAVLPSSLSAFNDIASNMGYHFSVSNIRYDKYNRISSFDYTIN